MSGKKMEIERASASFRDNNNDEKKNRNDKGEEGEKKKEHIMIKAPEDFDLESYIAGYTGHNRISRLIFIGDHCKELQVASYKMAIEEIKKTTNSTLYKSLTEKVGELIGHPTDQSWIDAIDKKAGQNQERIESDLNNSKASLAKEAIRIGHNELGDFHYNRGDLNSALKCYVRARDYCSTSSHILNMCLNVIKVSIEMGNYAHVTNYISKAESTPDLNDKVILSELKVASGLAQLEGKKYKPAARKFIETTIDLGTNWSDVILPIDVAIYGGLTALATFDRAELKKKVIDSPSFSNFLELVPELRELIQDFYSSNYASCLKHLEKMKSTLLLDIHLHEHVNSLFQKIRSKALIQYFSPFSSIDLKVMAEAFNTDVAGLEQELSALIIEGSISARIDSHNQRLYAKQTEQRSVTFDRTLKMGDEYQENSKATLLRINLMRNDFMVRPQRRDDKDKKAPSSGLANFLKI